MVIPTANRGNFRREGFGAGRAGRGAGRTGRQNVWQRTGRHNLDQRSDGEFDPSHGGRESDQGGEPFVGEERRSDTQFRGNESWGREDSPSNWDRKANDNRDPSQKEADDLARKEKGKEPEEESDLRSKLQRKSGVPDQPQLKPACNFCGLRNHTSEECKRRNACELCGFNNHESYDCHREPLWNLGPELCAAQVPNQSFFYIDEHVDQKLKREKASTAIVTVINGVMSAKQIEGEFRRIVGADVWKWSAKQVTESKFTMRFPNAKMVLDYSQFILGVLDGNAQMKIEPWSSSLGAKGQLQLAWFKIRGIPIDQRNIRTIVKVGGLVGKVMTIDEKARYNPDHVRVRIACRDVLAVPKTAESTLGIYLYDFQFELEGDTSYSEPGQSSRVKINDLDHQPNSKKPRMEHGNVGQGASKTTSSAPENTDPGHGTNHLQKMVIGGDTEKRILNSAPPKISYSRKKITTEVKKTAINSEPEFSDEVIPAATYEPSDSSDDFPTLVNKVWDDGAESSKKADNAKRNQR